MYCTCRQCLIDSESRRKFNKLRLDALSIQHYMIKKGATRGARHGKTEEQKEHQKAWNAWKRCCKKFDSQGGHFTGIHDRILRDPVFRESQQRWTNLQKKTIRIISLQRNFEDSKDKWDLTSNKSGKFGPMRLRPDFRAAVSLKNRLHRESGEQVEEPISPEQYRWHPSSSRSLWDKSEWNWKWAHKNFFSSDLFVTVGFVYNR